MSDQAKIDFIHGPPGVEPSSTPWSLHDGMLEEIAVDARTRMVSLRVDVGASLPIRSSGARARPRRSTTHA